MTAPINELEKRIEDAFHYRGHATLTFKDGSRVEGFLFNREFSNPRLKEDRFVELFLKGSGDKVRYRIDDLRDVELTGRDEAAGKSYQDWMEKQKNKDHTA